MSLPSQQNNCIDLGKRVSVYAVNMQGTIGEAGKYGSPNIVHILILECVKSFLYVTGAILQTRSGSDSEMGSVAPSNHKVLKAETLSQRRPKGTAGGTRGPPPLAWRWKKEPQARGRHSLWVHKAFGSHSTGKSNLQSNDMDLSSANDQVSKDTDRPTKPPERTAACRTQAQPRPRLPAKEPGDSKSALH